MTNDQVLKLVKTIQDKFNALVNSTSKFIKAFKEFQDNHICFSHEEAELLYSQLDEGIIETKAIKNKLRNFIKRQNFIKHRM